MEENNSWDGRIFQQIKARSVYLSSLIWRNQLKLEEDIPEEESENDRVNTKINLDPSDKSVIEWFDERQRNFKKQSEEAKSSDEPDVAFPGIDELSRNVGIPSDTAMSDVIKKNKEPKAAPHCWSGEASCIHPINAASPGTDESSRDVGIPSLDTATSDVIKKNKEPKTAPHCWSEETSCIHPANMAATEIDELSNARIPPDPVKSRDMRKLEKQEQRSPGYVRLKLKNCLLYTSDAADE